MYNLDVVKMLDKLKDNWQLSTLLTIVKDQIQSNHNYLLSRKQLYNEYCGDTAIKHRVVPLDKVNNRIGNDFRGDIVDSLNGFVFGEAVKYSIKKDMYSDSDYNKFSELLNEFMEDNDVSDLDYESGKYASICGYASRLMYLNKDGKPRIMNINPFESIFIYNNYLDEVAYGIIYYTVEEIVNGIKVNKFYVEFYDNTTVTYLVMDAGGQISPNLEYGEKYRQEHGFNKVPLLKFDNNDEKLGDFEKVNDAINAYDKIVSDTSNLIEEFNFAYMVFENVRPPKTAEERENWELLKKNGTIFLPENSNGGNGAKVSFLTKQIDGAIITDQRDMLKDNIYRFSKRIDFADEKFQNAPSGESRKWALINLENAAGAKERKFIKSCKAMFRILTDFWNYTYNTNFSYKDIEINVTRNLPVDLEYQARTTALLKGNVSEETRLSQLSIVKDIDAEIERMKQEKKDDANAYLADMDNDEVDYNVSGSAA